MIIMSKEIFEQKKKAIEAINISEVMSPNMPVAIAIQEAADLCAWCADDKKQLTATGLDWALVDDLPMRIQALRYIQSEWQKMFQSREEAQKEWAAALANRSLVSSA
jgi:hypothetical protein